MPLKIIYSGKQHQKWNNLPEKWISEDLIWDRWYYALQKILPFENVNPACEMLTTMLTAKDSGVETL